MKYERLLIVLIPSMITVLAFANAYPIEVTSLVTRNLEGVLTDTFHRGEIAVIETQIYCKPTYYYAPGGISYLEIIVMLYERENMMMGLLLTRNTITGGETKTFGGGIRIRLTDPTGTYRIEVYVWNGFPSEMREAWQPLAAIASTTITVVP